MEAENPGFKSSAATNYMTMGNSFKKFLLWFSYLQNRDNKT